MGLLDDAIREHLDLKRRRGADPAEVERAEREALGPVRRNTGLADASGDDGPTSGAPEDDRREGEMDWLEEDARIGHDDRQVTPEPGSSDKTSVIMDAGESEFERSAEPPAFNVEPIEATEAESWSATDADPAGLEPFPTAPPIVRRGGDETELDEPVRLSPAEQEDLGDATAEYRVGEHPIPEAGRTSRNVEVPDGLEGEDALEGEDVLEETPEFLQDTPDHDRLWFEQRPPRDFDFDG